jgi:hypothetical protein
MRQENTVPKLRKYAMYVGVSYNVLLLSILSRVSVSVSDDPAVIIMLAFQMRVSGAVNDEKMSFSRELFVRKSKTQFAHRL